MENIFLIGLFLVKMMTKYGYKFSEKAIAQDIERLTNQLWKLIPMRENDEPWKIHLSSLIVEISGLGKIYNNASMLCLLSKLEGIQITDIDFALYRKTVFEAITLLREAIK